ARDGRTEAPIGRLALLLKPVIIRIKERLGSDDCSLTLAKNIDLELLSRYRKIASDERKRNRFSDSVPESSGRGQANAFFALINRGCIQGVRPVGIHEQWNEAIARASLPLRQEGSFSRKSGLVEPNEAIQSRLQSGIFSCQVLLPSAIAFFQS